MIFDFAFNTLFATAAFATAAASANTHELDTTAAKTSDSAAATTSSSGPFVPRKLRGSSIVDLDNQDLGSFENSILLTHSYQDFHEAPPVLRNTLTARAGSSSRHTDNSDPFDGTEELGVLSGWKDAAASSKNHQARGLQATMSPTDNNDCSESITIQRNFPTGNSSHSWFLATELSVIPIADGSCNTTECQQVANDDDYHYAVEIPNRCPGSGYSLYVQSPCAGPEPECYSQTFALASVTPVERPSFDVYLGVIDTIDYSEVSFDFQILPEQLPPPDCSGPRDASVTVSVSSEDNMVVQIFDSAENIIYSSPFSTQVDFDIDELCAGLDYYVFVQNIYPGDSAGPPVYVARDLQARRLDEPPRDFTVTVNTLTVQQGNNVLVDLDDTDLPPISAGNFSITAFQPLASTDAPTDVPTTEVELRTTDQPTALPTDAPTNERRSVSRSKGGSSSMSMSKGGSSSMSKGGMSMGSSSSMSMSKGGSSSMSKSGSSSMSKGGSSSMSKGGSSSMSKSGSSSMSKGSSSSMSKGGSSSMSKSGSSSMSKGMSASDSMSKGGSDKSMNMNKPKPGNMNMNKPKSNNTNMNKPKPGNTNMNKPKPSNMNMNKPKPGNMNMNKKPDKSKGGKAGRSMGMMM